MARHSFLGTRDARHRCLAAALAVAGLATAGGSATAQQYRADKPKLTAVEAQQLRGKVSAILRQTTAPDAAGAKVVEDYLAGYYFPMMTNSNPDQLGKLADARKILFLQYINIAKSQAARDQLLALTLKAAQMQSIGNYHPAVRYNAALILGQLDQTAATGAGGAPPKPLPAATNSLVVLLERDEVGNVPITSAVKMAALVGLERHARLGVADPKLVERMTTEALEVANRQEPPADIAADVNSWMRCQAADVLVRLAATGVTAPMQETLVTLVGSNELGIDDRCRVAESLTAEMYQGAQGVDPEPMVLAIGRLAKAVLAEERRKAQEYQDEMVDSEDGGGFGGGFGGRGGRGEFGGGRGFGGRGGGGFGMTMEEDTGPHYEVRRLVDRLLAVQAAASAVSAGGSDELKQRVTALGEALQEAAEKAADDKTTELVASDLVLELARTVNGIVNSWSAEEGPAAGEDADDDELAAQ